MKKYIKNYSVSENNGGIRKWFKRIKDGAAKIKASDFVFKKSLFASASAKKQAEKEAFENYSSLIAKENLPCEKNDARNFSGENWDTKQKD